MGAAIRSVAEEFGVPDGIAPAVVRQAERDAGTRPRPTTSEREEPKRVQTAPFTCRASARDGLGAVIRDRAWAITTQSC